MSQQGEKKEIEKFDPVKSHQLNMFELLDSSLKDYSNSIELYDTMPKYYIGGVKRVKDKIVESLPILTRDFVHRGKPYKLDLSPAAILDKKNGKTIYYYPSQREELVEDALRKIATKGRAKEFNKNGEKKVGVLFTYYEVQQELERMGHGYSIAEIKLAVEILSKAVLEVTSKDDGIAITNNFFSFVGKETQEMGGKEKVVVIFHTLVAQSINTGNYRLFNYDRLMKMKMPLSRWLHKRISHMFLQATINNPYEIKLSTIVRDSGMKNYKTISERARQVEKALSELQKKEIHVLTRWEKVSETEKNKILDIKYSLFMSEEFVSDAKKANALTNLRLGKDSVEIGSFNVDDLRREIEKPIYGLTKTIINNHLNKISSKEEYDKIVNALEAVKGYIELKKSRNEKITNHGAITQKAIQQGWVPPKADSEEVKTDSIEDPQKIIERKKEEDKKLELRKELQNDPVWVEIRKKIQNSFSAEDWNKWFSKLDIFSIEEETIFLSSPDKFNRNWIVSEFLEKSVVENGKIKNLRTVIKEVCPNIDKVAIVVCVVKEK